MTTRTIIGFALPLLVACGGGGFKGPKLEHCDATFNGDDFDEETCKAVTLIVECLDENGVDADELSDEDLRAEIDACAVMFNFCSVDPVFEDHPALATFNELRGDTNMCVG